MSNCQLLKNINLMQNHELIGLAKNRFLPADIQMAIAKHPYRRVKIYLADNPNLAPDVRDYMWSDECNSGYTIKTDLLDSGHYRDNPEKYRELYDRFKSSWSRSPWRFERTFFYGHWNGRHRHSSTPSDVLRDIYVERILPSIKHLEKPWNSYYMCHGNITVGGLKRLAEHPNCALPLAIMLSTCGQTDVEKIAFQRIVQLSK